MVSTLVRLGLVIDVVLALFWVMAALRVLARRRRAKRAARSAATATFASPPEPESEPAVYHFVDARLRMLCRAPVRSDTEFARDPGRVTCPACRTLLPPANRSPEAIEAWLRVELPPKSPKPR